MHSLNWVYASDLPLPAGLQLEILATATAEHGQARLVTLEWLLGRDEGTRVVEGVGAYELSDELARDVRLRGGVLGGGNEIPALSPAAWSRHPEAKSLEALQASLKEGEGKVLGLMLTAEERGRFLAFLARNQVNPDSDPAEIVAIARHFFFDEPLNVVVRYTGPRFHHS